jgi:hypothetical protein
MLWIFDESRVSEGAFALIADLPISIARQWLLRSGAWKVALALVGAAAQVAVGGGGWWLFNSSRKFTASGAQMTPFMSELLLLTLCTVGVVAVMVCSLAFWVGRFNRRRVAAGRHTA